MKDNVLLALTANEQENTVRTLGKFWHRPRDLARTEWAETSLVSAMLLAGDEKDPEIRGRALSVVLNWALDKLKTGRLNWERMSYDILYARFVQAETINTFLTTNNIYEEKTARHRFKSAIKRLTKLLLTELQTPHELTWRKQAFIKIRVESLPENQKPILHTLASLRTWTNKVVAAQAIPDLSTTVLDALINGNLLLSADASYLIQVHPEIKQFLLSSLTNEQFTTIHGDWANFFTTENNYLEAIYHYQQARKFSKAADLLIQVRHKFGSPFLPLEGLRILLANFSEDKLSPTQWAHIKLLTGRLAEIAEDLPTAVNEFSQALSNLTDKVLEAEVQFWLGRTYRQHNQERSQYYYRLTKELLQELQSESAQQLMVRVLVSEAWPLFEQNDQFTAAEHNLSQATQIITPHRTDKTWFLPIGETYNAWGQFYLQCKQLNKALEHSLESERFIMASPDQDIEQVMNINLNLGMIEHRKAKYAEARTHFDIAWQLIEQTGNKRKKALCQKGFGMCYFSSGDYQQAIEYYLKMYIYSQETSHHAWFCSSCYDLAEAFHLAKNAVEAKKYYDQGLKVAHEQDVKKELRLLEELPQLLPQAKYLTPSLSQRQLQAIQVMLREGKITNDRYRTLAGVSQKTVVNEFNALIDKGICQRVGNGRSVHYILL